MLHKTGPIRKVEIAKFQWAPTLGGECYQIERFAKDAVADIGFNGHPPLGVNATARVRRVRRGMAGGFNGHPPLGVNATIRKR